MAPDSLTRAYERLLVDLPDDLPRVSFRNLRYTSLTLAYDSGAKITEVRNRAGHSSQAVTERCYLLPHASNDADIAYHMGQALEGLSYATEDVHLAIYRITHWEKF